MESLTTGEIIKRLRKSADLTIEKAALHTDIVISNIAEALIDGKEVMLKGLGKFVIRQRSSHKIKKIKTDETMELKPYKAVVFIPAKNLKRLLNK
jgi:nucleoid DNA-binding protein